MPRRRLSRNEQQIRPYRWSFAGMIGLAMVAFLVLASARTTPALVVVLLALGWVVLFVQACRWFVARPRGVAVLAVVAFAAWVLVVGYGTRVLGWGG